MCSSLFCYLPSKLISYIPKITKSESKNIGDCRGSVSKIATKKSSISNVSIKINDFMSLSDEEAALPESKPHSIAAKDEDSVEETRLQSSIRGTLRTNTHEMATAITGEKSTNIDEMVCRELYVQWG